MNAHQPNFVTKNGDLGAPRPPCFGKFDSYSQYTHTPVLRLLAIPFCMYLSFWGSRCLKGYVHPMVFYILAFCRELHWIHLNGCLFGSILSLTCQSINFNF